MNANIKKIRDLLLSEYNIKVSSKWTYRYLHYISHSIPQLEHLTLLEAEQRYLMPENLNELAFFIFGMRVDWNIRTFTENKNQFNTK